MKITTIIVMVLMTLALFAQTSQFAISTPSGTLTGCPAPASGSNIVCSVTDGYYVSVSGGAYAKVNVGASGGGVTSFNTRTGAVVAAPNDYKFSDLANKPTSFVCTTSNQSNSGLSASGCTFN